MWCSGGTAQTLEQRFSFPADVWSERLGTTGADREIPNLPVLQTAGDASKLCQSPLLSLLFSSTADIHRAAADGMSLKKG